MDIYWFDSSGKYLHKKNLKTTSKSDDTKRYKLCCAVCGNPVTTNVEAIEVEGSHEHVKINPQQRQFILRCFLSATGCRLAGEPTTDFTWFSGYAWRIAECNRCGTQMGWFFEGGKQFFVLIAEMLKPCEDS